MDSLNLGFENGAAMETTENGDGHGEGLQGVEVVEMAERFMAYKDCAMDSMSLGFENSSTMETMENGDDDGEGLQREGDEEAAENRAERSMDVVLRDGGLVAQIVQCLDSDGDRRAALLVCKIWSEAVVWSAHKLVLRSRSSLPQLAQRFWYTTGLDLSQCGSELEDQDLRVAAAAFLRLRVLRVGDRGEVQGKVTEVGVAAFAERCVELEQVRLSLLPLFRDGGVAVLVQRCRKLRVLHLESCESLGDEALEAIAGCRELQELSLKGKFRFTSAGLGLIGLKCGGLVKLVLHLDAVNIDLVLENVACGCLRLRDVSLQFKAAKLRELSRCTTLRSLAFESNERDGLDEAVVAIASANRNLIEVTCRYPLSESAVIAMILTCPRLQKLHLDASKMTQGFLPCIQQCKFLTDLSLDSFQSTGQGLAEIGLCGLDFRKFFLTHARGVRDMELQVLMDGNRQLEHLELQGCSSPTAVGYSAIALCTNLQNLDLSFTMVDDLSLINIASGVANLKQLAIMKCEAITNMGAVARFTSLESLILDCNFFVTDEGLDVLSRKCTRLTHLSLAVTRVTDTGLNYISKCPMLRCLRIPCCRGVRGAGVVTIAKACGWFHYVVLSHRLRGSRTADTLRQLCCTVRFEHDEVAALPVDANLHYYL